jgi:hypothetical protein
VTTTPPQKRTYRETRRHYDKERCAVCYDHCPFPDECHQGSRKCPFHPEHVKEEEEKAEGA